MSGGGSRRFVIRESSGWPIGTHGGPFTHVSIYDTAYCWREVVRYGTSRSAWSRSNNLATARLRVARRCARLNAEHDAWAASA